MPFRGDCYTPTIPDNARLNRSEFIYESENQGIHELCVVQKRCSMDFENIKL